MPEPKPLLVTECYLDTALADQLLQRSNFSNHQRGISNVARIMLKQPSRAIIGVVDQDKANVPTYFGAFQQIQTGIGLRLLKHPTKPHYLIFIAPAPEFWILEAAKEAGINTKEYSIPNDLDKFRHQSKREGYDRNPQILALLKNLRRLNPERIAQLRQWLEDFFPPAAWQG